MSVKIKIHHVVESKGADEKLGYEKGHKNSRGEDAPWVIRSHEDNRILASFANKKDAEEHMKRMKQYSNSESKQNEGLSNEKVKDAVKFAATEAGLENYLNVDSDGAMSVTVSLPINSDYLKTVRWVIDSNDGTITEYLDTEKNLIRDFTDDESLVSMLTLLFQTSRMELRDWFPKKSESVNMGGFNNMLRTYNEKGGSVKNGPWRICDGAYDLWFELYYNETPILGCTDNICKWYSNPETVGMTLDDYKKIENAISSEIFAIDSFKMPESKKSEDADDVTYELTEDAVTGLIKELGLEIVNTWYDGNKDRIVYDCKDMGDENGETVCVWVEPPYEARVWLKDVNPRVNQLVEGLETLDALKAALVDIFKIELGESHVTESLRKPEDTIIVPNWLWETYTLGENYDGDTLTDDEQQTFLDFKEKYEEFSLKAVSEKTTFRSDNDFDNNGCPCYEVNVFKK